MVTLTLTPAEARAFWLHVSCFPQEDAEAFQAAADHLYTAMEDAEADTTLPIDPLID